MFGHGRPPRPMRLPIAHRAPTPAMAFAGMLALFVASGWSGGEAVAAAAAPLQMRVRLEWGGGAARQWQGMLQVRGGRILDVEPLGTQADELSSLWRETDHVVVGPPTPRSYMGADLLIEGTPDAVLITQLHADGDSAPQPPIEIALSRLVNEVVEQNLDNQRNWIQVRRSPGDRLRVDVPRASLIYAPQEDFRCQVSPYQLGVKAGTRVEYYVVLTTARGEAEISRLEPIVQTADPHAVQPFSVDFKLPAEEGVYEVVIAAAVRSLRIPPSLNAREWLRETIARRKVQLIVLRGMPSPAFPESSPELLEEIDPTNPAWWQRWGAIHVIPNNMLPSSVLPSGMLPSSMLPSNVLPNSVLPSHVLPSGMMGGGMIPGMRKGPLSSGAIQPWSYAIGRDTRKLVQLGAGDRATEPSWQAYTLAIRQVGVPHAIEIEYPANMPQNLGLSIFEAGAAGEGDVTAIHSGVYVPEEAAPLPPQIETHRILFWPRTRTPILVVMNRRPRGFAAYGKIKVEQLAAHLPEATAQPAPASPQSAGPRLLAAYLQQPVFPENFSASEALDPQTRRTFQDWQSFYEGGTRLVEYLKHTGRNTLFIQAVGDGTALYPSLHVRATPRYDSGMLSSEGHDPIHKDVLEMLLRITDREQLTLIPGVRFTGALIPLEIERRRPDGAGVGIELVGGDGRTYAARYRTDPGSSPLYNPLDPRVQAAMLGVVRELVARYGQHPSFGGVSIELSAQTFAQLPGVAWGLDDRTMGDFAASQGITLPMAGPDRFRLRAEMLSQEPLRAKWLWWRAERLAAFYLRLQAEVSRGRPGARLYLSPVGLWESIDAERELRRMLPQGTAPIEPLLAVGFAPRLYQGPGQPTLLRPQEAAPSEALSTGVLNLELNESRELDQEFPQAINLGGLFFHPTHERPLSSFDATGMFRGSSVRIAAQASPSGAWNRQRFAHAMATLDPLILADGGAQLPLGQEGAIRDLVAVYRALPAVRFQTLGDASQPLVVRYWQGDRETYTYMVNDSPWPATLRIKVAGAAGLVPESLSRKKLAAPAAGGIWEISFEPFEVVGARFAAVGVKFSEPQASLGPQVTQQLKQQVNDLSARLGTLMPLEASPESPLMAWNLQDKLPSPGFELPTSREEPLPGWGANVQPGVEVQIETEGMHSGKSCCHIQSRGPIATLASPTFDPPHTGILLMSVWIRTAGNGPQSPLRLAIEGTRRDGPYYRFAPIGAGPGSPPLDGEWRSFLFRVDDLPLAGLTDLRVRFDLMGAGNVMIDDVQLSTVMITGPELVHLRKNVATARFAIDANRPCDARRLLSGYWPRLLVNELPLVQTAVTAAPESPAGDLPPATPLPAAPSASWYDRLMPSWFR